MTDTQTCPPSEPATDLIAEPILDVPARVQALLHQSRAAHHAKKQCAGRANKDGIVTSQPNYPAAEQHIREAIRTREEAEALDPDHTAPAWAEDLGANKGLSSAGLLNWFRHYLAIP